MTSWSWRPPRRSVCPGDDLPEDPRVRASSPRRVLTRLRFGEMRSGRWPDPSSRARYSAPRHDSNRAAVCRVVPFGPWASCGAPPEAELWAMWASREAGQSRTAGAGGGSRETAGGDTGTRPRVYLTITCLSGRPWTNRDAPSSSALQIEHHGAAEKDHPHHLLPHRQLTRGAPTRWHERDSGGEQKPANGQDEPQPLPPIARGVSGRMILGQHAHQTKIHREAGISIPRTSGSTAGGGAGLASLCCAGIRVICCRMAAPGVNAAASRPFGQSVERSFYCRSCRLRRGATGFRLAGMCRAFADAGGGGRQRRSAHDPVGFQNSATGLDLGFYVARSYSLRRPPRTGLRLIRCRERSATR
jgi:hypothetical protein